MMKIRRLLVGILACCLCIQATGVSSLAQSNQKVYLLSYFGGEPYSESLHLAYSHDGKNWTTINYNQPIFLPDVDTGRLRDPYLYKKQDGSYVLLGTVGADTGQQTLMLYDTNDLVNYTNGRIIQMNNQGWHAWAPEVFYDEANERYGIIWSGNSGYHKTYVNYTTDFETVTDPEIFFDAGYDQIDAHILKDNNMYYLFYKDERFIGKRVQVAKSTTGQAGSFTTYTDYITPRMTEGPFIIKNNNKYLMYVDFFTQGGKFGLWETDDLNSGQWQQSNDFNLPAGVRHANAIEISNQELQVLKEAFEKPHSSFRSYNYPDKYIRHCNYALEIAEQDQIINDFKWQVIPGLADSQCVTLESINYPGYYVRHKNGKLYIEKSDGTQLFKEDATFYMENGLADSSMVSFRSYNFSDHYIRHAHSKLVIDTNDGSSLFKDDATFKRITNN